MLKTFKHIFFHLYPSIVWFKGATVHSVVWIWNKKKSSESWALFDHIYYLRSSTSYKCEKHTIDFFPGTLKNCIFSDKSYKLNKRRFTSFNRSSENAKSMHIASMMFVYSLSKRTLCKSIVEFPTKNWDCTSIPHPDLKATQTPTPELPEIDVSRINWREESIMFLMHFLLAK